MKTFIYLQRIGASLLSCLSLLLGLGEIAYGQELSLHTDNQGCILSASRGADLWKQNLVLSTSGVPRIDEAIGRETAEIATYFGTDAEFAFLNDRANPNAYAVRETAHTGPRVLFGLRLLHETIGTLNPIGTDEIPKNFPFPWGGSLAAVIAHEWAHLLQFKNGVRSRGGNVSPLELQADYLSGWYMGMKSKMVSIDLNELVQWFESIGDNDTGSESHHGTPEQRAMAFLSGYNIAKSGEANVTKVFEAGVRKYDLVYK